MPTNGLSDGYFEHPDADTHAVERIRRMEEALARAERVPRPAMTTYDGKEVTDARSEEGFEEGAIEIGMEGSLLEMMLERGEPNEDESWAVRDVWKPGSLTLVVGTQQSFKSWSMMDLLYHAADGTNWLDKAIHEPYDHCVYVSGEKGSKAVYERLWLLFKDRHDLANKVLIKHRKDGLKFGSDTWSAFVEEVHLLPGRRTLVILDTLTSLAPGGYDENNLKDVSRMLESVRALQKGETVDVILVHHLNAAGERPRGHSALDGEVDGFVRMDRRGRDIDEVLVRFEPKDGLPSMGSYRFDPKQGMFQRASARALHIANLKHVVQWWQDRNNGEGITMRELRDTFYSSYRYHQVEEMVQRALDELVLRKEERTSMLTNRTANIITVMDDEERESILRQRRSVKEAEVEAEAKQQAILNIVHRADRAMGHAEDAELGIEH